MSWHIRLNCDWHHWQKVQARSLFGLDFLHFLHFLHWFGFSAFSYEVICSVIFPRNVVPLKLQSRYIFRYKILENVVCLVFRYQDKNGSWCGQPMVHSGFEVVPISLVHWVSQLVWKTIISIRQHGFVCTKYIEKIITFGIVQYWSRLEQ